MNKVKMFFVAAALMLTTAGVFAGKAFFTAPANIFYWDGTAGVTHYHPVTSSVGSTAILNIDGTGAQAYLYNATGTGYPLYSGSGGTYTAISETAF